MEKPQKFLDMDYRLRKAALMLMYLVIACIGGYILFVMQPVIKFTLTVLSPFIVALIVAYIFNPIVSWLQRKFGLGRIAGVLITYSLILMLAIGFFALLVPVLYTQLSRVITNIVNNYPLVVDKINEWLRLKVSEAELAQAKEFIRQNINLSALADKTGAAAGNVAQSAFDTTKLITKAVGTTISVIIGFFALATFVVVICFYLLLDYGRFEHIARVLLPEDKESRVFNIWSKIDHALGGYLRGQLIVATTIGILYTIGLMLMGMQEYAILIGFLAGFGNMIPYLGPVIGGVPAGMWVLFGSTYDTSEEKLIGIGIIVLFSIAVQTLDGLFLQPRVVGKSAELHPLLVLLALIIGAQFGLGGMIIAVPVAIMVRVVLKELWWDPLEQQEFENKRMARLAAGNSPRKSGSLAFAGKLQTPATGSALAATTQSAAATEISTADDNEPEPTQPFSESITPHNVDIVEDAPTRPGGRRRRKRKRS